MQFRTNYSRLHNVALNYLLQVFIVRFKIFCEMFCLAMHFKGNENCHIIR